MGISCRPIGKFRSVMQKLQNQLDAEKAEKAKIAKEAKERHNKSK